MFPAKIVCTIHMVTASFLFKTYGNLMEFPLHIQVCYFLNAHFLFPVYSAKKSKLTPRNLARIGPYSLII